MVIIRATAVRIEDDQILLVQQRVTESLDRRWSLPGGTLECGETLEACVKREVREETGLEVEVDSLLYLCDRIADGRHVTHITLAVKRTGGQMVLGNELEPGANPIGDVKMVPLATLPDYGFSQRFAELAAADFANRGTYQGLIDRIQPAASRQA